MLAAGLKFPPISHLLEWPNIIFGINKPVLIYFGAVIVTLLLFFLALRSKSLVPTGVRNIMEMAIEFVERDIIGAAMGPSGMPFLPFLTSLFFFIFFSNITEVIPGIQFPANARMAMPAFLAIVVFIVTTVVGFKYQGGSYIKNTLIPPGVPGFLIPLIVLIEFVSNFVVRPFSLAVRLFANMLAGHLLLVTFAVLSATLFSSGLLAIITPLPFLVLIGLTGFEIVVAFLQAFIFTILTAVYIGGAMHPEH